MKEIESIDSKLAQTDGMNVLAKGLPDLEPSALWRAELQAKLFAIDRIQSIVSKLPEFEPIAEWRTELASKINQEALRAIPNFVQALPDEVPSPTWREALDARLERLSVAPEVRKQSVFGRLLKGLPVASPSMVWRSQLNERIRATSGTARRGFHPRLIRPTLAVGLASVLFAAVAIQLRPAQGVSSRSQPSVTDWMIETHEESVAYSNLGVVQPVEYSGVTVIEEPADLSMGGI